MPTTTPFANLITFSRGSNATVVGPNGLVQWAPNNLVTFSEQFDNAAWVTGLPSPAPVTANTFAAPDGTTTADTIAPALATPSRRNQSAVTSGATYTASIWVRAAPSGSATHFRITSNNTVAWNTGASTKVALTTSWQRVSVTWTQSGSSLANIVIGASDVAGVNDADCYGNVLVWGAQLEVGSAATTYNPTTVKNLLGFSEAFDNAAWAKGNASIVTGAQANPVNGLFNAQKLMEDTANAQHRIFGSGTAVAGGIYTFSVYAKAAGRSFFSLYPQSGTAASALYNLANGTSANGSVTTNLISHAIQAVGGDWFRCSLTFTATGTTILPHIYLRDSAGAATAPSYTGDGNSGIYIYGAQLSDSASLDPYVPTPGAAPSSTAYYGPRFDYDPVTLQPRGILIEEQRTNLLTYSAEFDNAAWGKFVSASVTANTTTAPDGTATADTLTLASTANSRIEQTVTVSSGQTYTFSVWMRVASGTLSVRLYGIDTGAGSAFTVNTSWQRFSITQVASSGTRFPAIVTDGTAGSVFIWGAQLEAGAFATSYIPTIASTATRNADSLFLSGQNFAQWYRQDAGAWYAEFNVLDQAGVTYTVSDGTGNNRFIGYPASSVQLEITTGGVLQASLDGGTITPNTNVKVASAYATNDAALSLNGGTAVSDASVTLPTVNQSRIGANVGGGNLLNGWFRNLIYAPVRAANFQLQALTQLPPWFVLAADGTSYNISTYVARTADGTAYNVPQTVLSDNGLSYLPV